MSELANRTMSSFTLPLRDYISCGDNNMVQARLAKAVLAEVPQQFLSYMKKHGIQPPQQRINVQSLPGSS